MIYVNENRDKFNHYRDTHSNELDIDTALQVFVSRSLLSSSPIDLGEAV